MPLRTARIIPLLAIAFLAACETYRTEYHRRPAYYQQAALGEMPDRVTLDDGTTLVFRTNDPRRRQHRETAGDAAERKPFQMREEHDDGSVTLRAIVPEHVLSNLLTCLHNEEYELIWEQLLSDHTKRAWEQEGGSLDEFIEYFSANRGHMIQAINRIYLGLSSFETIMEYDEHGVLECRLRHSGARGLRFSRVRMIPEGPGLKLVNVR